jgi:predicted peroxiredoxin
MPDRLVIKVTHADDDPERCLVALNVAAAALASGLTVALFLAFDGVRLATPGSAERLEVEASPNGQELLDSVLGAGASVTVCGPCATRRGLVESDFIDGTTVAGSAAFVAEIAAGATPLVY